MDCLCTGQSLWPEVLSVNKLETHWRQLCSYGLCVDCLCVMHIHKNNMLLFI